MIVTNNQPEIKYEINFDVICEFDFYDCEDFTSFDSANMIYRFCHTKYRQDTHNLDANNDDVPCNEKGTHFLQFYLETGIPNN